MGLVEPGPLHFAPARLGYNAWITRVLGKDIDERYIVLMSRVLEKGAAFALHLKEWLLSRLRDIGVLKPWMTVVNWSDCGPHFRANTVLAHSMTRLPELFQCHTDVRYCLECHGKSSLDAKGGLIRRLKFEASAGRWLRTIGHSSP